MIKVIDKTEKIYMEPFYTVTFNYMLGDANGDTCEGIRCSLDDPYVEKVVTIFNSLKPTPGTWGIVFDDDYLFELRKYHMLSEEDIEFIRNIMYYEDIEEPLDRELYKFYECIRSNNEYTFLVFQGVELKYVDEYGIEYETEIV